MHTPSPWYVSGNIVVKDIKDKAYPIAEVKNWSEETEYNAKLIAAAPEMFKLLNDLKGSGLEIGSWMSDIENVIKKAKGE